MKNLFVALFAVISHTVTFCIALELASGNPSCRRADQANLPWNKEPVPYIDLVAESKI